MRQVRRGYWVAVGLLLLVVLWVTGALSTGREWVEQRLQQLDLSAPAEDDPREPAEPEEPQVEVPVIQPSTVLVFETRYLPCNLTAQEEYPADPAQVGQSREQFLMYNPGWEIVAFSSEQVVAYREVTGRCEELLARRTIRLQAGVVTVFFGDGGPHSPVMAVTDIREADLLPSDRERLRAGITVDSESEVWIILEGLEH